MEIISQEIDGKLEAVLYDDGGNYLMTLPRYKDGKGKEWVDVDNSILTYMVNQERGLPNYKEDADRVDIAVDNYKKYGSWQKPTALDKLLNQTQKVYK